MELNIIDLDSSILLSRVRIFNQQFVVYTEFAFRHTRELRLHKDLPDDICLKYSSSDRKQYVHILYNVYENFISLVADALSSPRDGTCGLYCDLLKFFNVLKYNLQLRWSLTFTAEAPCFPCVMYIFKRSGSRI